MAENGSELKKNQAPVGLQKNPTPLAAERRQHASGVGAASLHTGGRQAAYCRPSTLAGGHQSPPSSRGVPYRHASLFSRNRERRWRWQARGVAHQ